MWRDAARKLIPASLRETLVALLTSEIVGAAVKAKVWVNSKGCKFQVDHIRISNREAAGIFWGIRERAEVDLVKQLLPISSDSTVVELGGSIGVVASHVAKRKPKRIVVVEADPELLEICEVNVNINISSDTAAVFLNRAVDYISRDDSLFVPGNTTTSGKLGHGSAAASGITVGNSTLSKILNSLSVGEYILISDIEGAEADIWFMDQQALNSCSHIVAELEDTKKYTAQAQLEQLGALGFRITYGYGRVYLLEKLNSE